jgi:threonine dehydrogenase-like Zn-dependent dehydrogenase
MKAVCIEQPNRVTVADLPVPQPGRDEALIRVVASGICGTDIHILHGEYLARAASTLILFY